MNHRTLRVLTAVIAMACIGSPAQPDEKPTSGRPSSRPIPFAKTSAWK